MSSRRQQNEWTEFLRRYAAQSRGRIGRAATTIDRARVHHQRDAWTNFLRRHATELRSHIVRRFWGPVVRARFWTRVLIGCCSFAAALLIVSLVVHASTFLDIDPMAKWPGVMFIHLAIFPPFIAALYYSSRIGGEEQGRQDRVFKSAPPWLRILAGVFFAYTVVNFGGDAIRLP